MCLTVCDFAKKRADLKMHCVGKQAKGEDISRSTAVAALSQVIGLSCKGVSSAWPHRHIYSRQLPILSLMFATFSDRSLYAEVQACVKLLEEKIVSLISENSCISFSMLSVSAFLLVHIFAELLRAFVSPGLRIWCYAKYGVQHRRGLLAKPVCSRLCKRNKV